MDLCYSIKIMDQTNNLLEKVPKILMPNILKALDRLSASAIDIPTAYLEGVAKEKRSETEGRIKLTQESSKQIANQMNISEEYVRNTGICFSCYS